MDGTCVVSNFELAIYNIFTLPCFSLLDVMASLDQKIKMMSAEGVELLVGCVLVFHVRLITTLPQLVSK